MKTIVMILFLSLTFGCAANDAITTKEDTTKGPFSNVETATYKPSVANVNPPKQQQQVIVKEVVKVKEVMVNDPNAIKINNLSWDTSDNAKWVSTDPKTKLFFDLGVCFQLGLADGFNSRKLTREERLKMYPIFKEYNERNKVGFIDVNVAYEGGYEGAMRFLSEQPMQAAPQKQEQPKK